MQISFGIIALALSGYLLSWAWGPVSRVIIVLGVLRKPSNTYIQNANDIVTFPDTVHCEDLHHHLPSNRLFTACEDSPDSRFKWFPALCTFDDQTITNQGSIHVLNPETMTSQKLLFKNFDSPFVTHGIDVITDPSSADAVYIYAVNHLPNPEYSEKNQHVSKARSQVELFHHVLGSTSVTHVRSIQHPAIKTPNDVFGVNSTAFYVTNDHHYREGLIRTVEDAIPAAKWSNTLFVQIDDKVKTGDPTAGLIVREALSGLHNNNGLGHGAQNHGSEEILVASAGSGVLYLTTRSPRTNDHNLTVLEAIPVDSTIDNPSYFLDPYPDVNSDASGYILAGLTRGADLDKHKRDPDAKDPIMVWHIRRGDKASWEKRLIFEDDGAWIRSSSAGVIVAIDPANENGKKKGWLFVTGFLSKSIRAIKIDLSL